MNDPYKEVYYNSYCQTCIHFDKSGGEEPCNKCLGEPANLYSHKPTKYVEKEKKNGD